MKTIQIDPSNNLFDELGKNNYDFKDLISELIDNSLAARIEKTQLNVTIEIYQDNGRPARFVIRDDARGITTEDLPLALSPGARQSNNSLNEHGMGMKQSIAALGKLEYLATKTKEDKIAKQVKELKFGPIPLSEFHDFPFDHGTEISITQLKPIVKSTPQAITQGLKDWLGARYRYFLRPESKVLNLEIKLKDISGKDLNVWQIEEVKPIYFHTGSRHNEPVINSFPLGQGEWTATLTFGYAPDELAEYEELGIEPPMNYHPYKVSMSNQGLDILLHDRVIKFHQLSELGIVSSKHPDFNTIRGEIKLGTGFQTAITKNSIIDDDNFSELIEKIRNILNGRQAGPSGRVKNYLRMKSYPDQIPEALLRDRLIEWLKTNPLTPRSQVDKEYAIKGIDGYADILADGEVWELKIDQANSKDVYQLFMYMDIGEHDKGFLVASDFTPGAKIAAREIKERHGKEIVLTEKSTLPINDSPTPDEREQYY